jgi:hypothetical protein
MGMFRSRKTSKTRRTSRLKGSPVSGSLPPASWRSSSTSWTRSAWIRSSRRSSSTWRATTTEPIVATASRPTKPARIRSLIPAVRPEHRARAAGGVLPHRLGATDRCAQRRRAVNRRRLRRGRRRHHHRRRRLLAPGVAEVPPVREPVRSPWRGAVQVPVRRRSAAGVRASTRRIARQVQASRRRLGLPRRPRWPSPRRRLSPVSVVSGRPPAAPCARAGRRPPHARGRRTGRAGPPPSAARADRRSVPPAGCPAW